MLFLRSPGNRPLLRIGELSQRPGMSDHVLQAWENRYGLPHPARSPGGFRLYSEADEWRLRRMQAYRANGALSAAPRQALDASGEPARLIAGDPVTEAERAGWSR